MRHFGNIVFKFECEPIFGIMRIHLLVQGYLTLFNTAKTFSYVNILSLTLSLFSHIFLLCRCPSQYFFNLCFLVNKGLLCLFLLFGFDSLINDETALGLALSYIKTDIKHKDKNAGDKTKADSFIVSAYGTYEITKEWFVQSVATFGHSKIKNREIRTEFGATNIAAADYNATSWGAEILTGYNQKIRDNVMFTPLFGLEFNRANGINYKETGTNTQNLAINRGSTNQLEAILGARISAVHAMDIYQKYVTFLPEIHGNARYGLLNNKLDIDIRQDGVSGPSLVPRTAKQARMVYNVGGSITAKYNDQWEYAIGYDARLADKYVAHQGTLNLRLNF